MPFGNLTTHLENDYTSTSTQHSVTVFLSEIFNIDF